MLIENIMPLYHFNEYSLDFSRQILKEYAGGAVFIRQEIYLN
jgi:hypothetical protein